MAKADYKFLTDIDLESNNIVNVSKIIGNDYENISPAGEISPDLEITTEDKTEGQVGNLLLRAGENETEVESGYVHIYAGTSIEPGDTANNLGIKVLPDKEIQVIDNDITIRATTTTVDEGSSITLSNDKITYHSDNHTFENALFNVGATSVSVKADNSISINTSAENPTSYIDISSPDTDILGTNNLTLGNAEDSNYIEFYRNNYIKPKFGAGYDPAPYDRTAVPQFFIKDSMELKNAVQMVGIDTDSYDVNNIYTQVDGTLMANRPGLITHSYNEYISELRANNIFVFDKKTTVFYNNHPEAEFCSFSKKESQKIIANTTGLYSQEEGTTANIGDNFIIDMDRCIQFIKNVDDIPMYFVVDAGLSTIAQFCDNVVWDEEAKKWVTQQFDPDNDPDAEDRYITDYTDVSTWRKVVDKLDQISREIRRDCMTIIDAPRQLTLDGAAQKIRRSKPSNNFDELIGDKLIYISGINSSYTAGYYNWLRTTDTYTGKSFWLPPTCKIIGNLCYLNIINLPWLAPAGLNYGIVNGIHGVSHNPGSTEEDIIYQKSWNYVKQYPFDGFIIEGQKTTLTKNSAFNRINVRLLFLDLERYVYNVARNFKYQVNNQYTREQFVQTIKPKFEDYLIRGGLYDYLIKCDGTNNTAETIDQQELRCAIYLKPARLIEFILVDFIATKSGANFEEIVT